jgi:ATP-dependent Clp protease adaptor protein ClpS
MKERTLHKRRNLKKGNDPSSLVLYNDEYNTFDHVIKSLVEVCGHDHVQAEQCAMIVHYRGSYEIKLGPSDILTSMSRSLNARGLTSRVIT